MKSLAIPIAVVLLPTLGACSSSLHVRPSSAEDARGIPFVLPSQSFEIEELGLDENGKPVADAGVGKRIVLVTGVDPSRSFRVANAPVFAADGKFSITRRKNGTAQAVTGKATSQALETITELASVAVSLAALAAADRPPSAIEAELRQKRAALPQAAGQAKQDLEAEIAELEKEVAKPEFALRKELESLTAIESALVDDLRRLAGVNGAKEARAKTIREALALVQARKAELAAALKPKRGVNVSTRTRIPAAEVHDTTFANIAPDQKTIPNDEFRVYLVPVH